MIVAQKISDDLRFAVEIEICDGATIVRLRFRGGPRDMWGEPLDFRSGGEPTEIERIRSARDMAIVNLRECSPVRSERALFAAMTIAQACDAACDKIGGAP